MLTCPLQHYKLPLSKNIPYQNFILNPGSAKGVGNCPAPHICRGLMGLEPILDPWQKVFYSNGYKFLALRSVWSFSSVCIQLGYKFTFGAVYMVYILVII
jgi:hypothetical protein